MTLADLDKPTEPTASRVVREMASQGLLRESWFSVRTCSRIDISASSISGGAHNVTGKCAPVTASSCARSLLISASRPDLASWYQFESIGKQRHGSRCHAPQCCALG